MEARAHGSQLPWHPQPQKVWPSVNEKRRGPLPPNTGGGKEAKDVAGVEPEGEATTSGALGQAVPPSAMEIHWVILSAALTAYLTGLL